jgi:hypothetical protein
MIYKVIKKSHSYILFNCIPTRRKIDKVFVPYQLKIYNSIACYINFASLC